MNQEKAIKSKSTTQLCFATLGNIPALSSISGRQCDHKRLLQ